MPSIRVALLQLNLTQGVEASLGLTEVLLSEAQNQGSDLVLFPELFPHPWFPTEEDSRHFALAQAIPGILSQHMAALARRFQTTLVVPLYEDNGSRRYNTTIVISDHGDILFRYQKNHIPYHPGWFEKYYYDPGTLGFPVFHFRGARIGIQTCWDNLFPEGTRLLALQGADIVLAPRGTGNASLHRWRTQLAGNALANNLFVVSVNRIGLEGGQWMFGGDSFAVGPDGNMIDALSGDNEVRTVELDLGQVMETRREWPFFYDRRPELYQRLVNRRP